MVETPKLTVTGLSYVVSPDGGRRAILNDVSFSVPVARFFTILGPSGSGKSTLLRCLNRLVEPTSGRVEIDGAPAAAVPVQELRRRVGMVFQTAALFDGTVVDNLLYGPRLRHEHVDDTGFARALLERVGLPRGFAEKAVGELSGGEAQRVSLARALAHRPEVLLLDEPTASLDPSASAQVERLLLELAAEHDMTYLFVSHDLEQARRLGDRGLLLVDGRVVEQGPLAEILADPGTDIMRLFLEGRLGGGEATTNGDVVFAANGGGAGGRAANGAGGAARAANGGGAGEADGETEPAGGELSR